MKVWTIWISTVSGWPPWNGFWILLHGDTVDWGSIYKLLQVLLLCYYMFPSDIESPCNCYKLGQAWASPTLIVTTACVCMYIHMYLTFSPAFVTPWFPRSAHPEMFRVFRYTDVLTCVICNWQQGQRRYALSAMKIIYKDTGRWMRKHMVYNEFSLLRQWSCSCPATC